MNGPSSFMEIDMQLAQLLGTMSLNSQRKLAFASEELSQTARTRPVDDAAMSDSSSSDSEDSTYQPSTVNSSNSNSNATAPAVAPPSPPICGCAYLQAILGQIRSGVYSTTTGDYLETIFTHREALYAFPQGHRECAVGFSELAGHLARRERQVGYRPDWEGDSDAVNAFRNEAWVIANTL